MLLYSNNELEGKHGMIYDIYDKIYDICYDMIYDMI